MSGVIVKPLEWHKSNMPAWDGDWHTTTPVIYTVRCADENGWKWSSSGGHGYAWSPEAAAAAAQADYEARILSAIDTTALDAELSALRSQVSALTEERDRLRADCGILLAEIDGLEECTGEGPEGEDRALVEQIRAALSPKPEGE